MTVKGKLVMFTMHGDGIHHGKYALCCIDSFIQGCTYKL